MSTAAPFAILVLGMHRSGTSAVNRVMIHAGVDLESNPNVPAADSPLGYWEHEVIRNIDAEHIRQPSEARREKQ